MIQDLNLQFDTNVAVTTNAASTNYIDMLAAGDAMEAGDLPQWKVLLTTSFSISPTAGTLTLQLQTSDSPLFDSTAVTLVQSGAITLNGLVAQTANVAPPTVSPVLINTVIPVGLKRYVRTYYVISAGAGTISAGKVTSQIVLDTDKLISPTLTTLQK